MFSLKKTEIIYKNYNNLYKESINLACEVIQVAAMARKGILSNIEIYKEDNKENALQQAAERGGAL